jgi:hypothetical protein
MIVSKMEYDMNHGKSIVIYPSPESNLKWSKTDKSKPLLLTDFEIGDFRIMSIDAGTYYIKGAYISKSSKEFDLEFVENYISAIGNITVQRTPKRSQQTITEKHRGKFSKWEETKKVVKTLDSRYLISYTITNNDKYMGKIIVNKNEVVLIPSIWLDVVLATKSCRQKEGILLFEFIKVFNDIFSEYSTDDFSDIYWNCPIKALLLNIKMTSLEDFMSRADKKSFSTSIMDKVVVREFEFGEMFKNATLKTLEDGTKQYIIYGNTDVEQENSD